MQAAPLSAHRSTGLKLRAVDAVAPEYREIVGYALRLMQRERCAAQVDQHAPARDPSRGERGACAEQGTGARAQRLGFGVGGCGTQRAERHVLCDAEHCRCLVRAPFDAASTARWPFIPKRWAFGGVARRMRGRCASSARPRPARTSATLRSTSRARTVCISCCVRRPSRCPARCGS